MWHYVVYVTPHVALSLLNWFPLLSHLSPLFPPPPQSSASSKQEKSQESKKVSHPLFDDDDGLDWLQWHFGYSFCLFFEMYNEIKNVFITIAMWVFAMGVCFAILQFQLQSKHEQRFYGRNLMHLNHHVQNCCCLYHLAFIMVLLPTWKWKPFTDGSTEHFN